VTAESTNLQKELRAYRWEQDKNGRNLNRPVDKDNHGIDAVRYVCLNLLTTHRRGVYHLA
jgi:phage terminase large subunit